MEAYKDRLKTISFPFGAFMCKIANKGECSAQLWSFNLLSELMQAAN